MGVGTQAACRNCDTPLIGAYCSVCGQRDPPPDPTLSELLGEAWDAFVSVDGRVVRSIRLLVSRPGGLTTEYLRGHRARFLPPLRLYLACSVLYFLVVAALADGARTGTSNVSFTNTRNGQVVRAGSGDDETVVGTTGKPGETSEQAIARDSVAQWAAMDSSRRVVLDSLHRHAPPGALDSASRSLADSFLVERKVARELGADPGWLKRTFYPRFIRNGVRIGRDKKNFGRTLTEQVPRMMFVLMPAFALLLALMYRSRRRRYPTHLIVSLHVHAFGFVALTLVAILGKLPTSLLRSVVLAAVLLWMAGYVPLALRSVYGGRLWVAAARSVALLGAYVIVASVAVTVGALLLVVLY